MRRLAGAGLALLLAGCSSGEDVTSAPAQPASFANDVRSILAPPPVNHSLDVGAPEVYLSTITRPLAEAGYWVPPVALVAAFMRANGAPDPRAMRAAPRETLREVFGTDAVLWIDILDFGRRYQLLSSVAIASVRAELVDLRTGELLWSGEAEERIASRGSSDVVDALINAALDQMLDPDGEAARQAAASANRKMIGDPKRGLPPGPYARPRAP